eukprot:UN32614
MTIDLHNLDITYPVFVSWLGSFGLLCCLIVIYYIINNKISEFGFEYKKLISIFWLMYTMDMMGATFYYFCTDYTPKVLRPFNLAADFITIIYCLTAPLVKDNLILHILIIIFRDACMAVSADLIRIYSRPDNEHNCKRIANLNGSVHKSGLMYYVYTFKTPIIRGVVEHYAVQYFLLMSVIDGLFLY